MTQTLDQFVAELKDLGATSVWLYGSLAKGTAHRRSDVDLFAAAPPDVQREIDHRYALKYPRVLVDGVVRPVQIFVESITGTNDPAFFCQMQPEARRIDSERIDE